MKDSFEGLRRQIAAEKKNGKRKAEEGKTPLPFPLYIWLCDYFISNGDLFAWAYTTLAWNLISSTGDIATLCDQHIDLGPDCLQIRLPRTKLYKGNSFSFRYFENEC